MLTTTARRILLLALVAFTVDACGVNVFKSGEAVDPAEDATLALERSDETAAITILEDALEGDPGNPQLLSILALAYAQRAGIEPLAFAQRLAANDGAEAEEGTGSETGTGTDVSSEDKGSLVALFDVMPEATAENLEDIDRAVEILLSEIDPADRLAGDPFKLAIYQTASLVMHLKALDTDGDGTLSLEEITNLSDLSAASIVQQLAMAQASIAADESASASTTAAAAALGTFQTDIDAAPGETPDERLRNYLAAKSGQIPDDIDTSTLTGTDTSTDL